LDREQLPDVDVHVAGGCLEDGMRGCGRNCGAPGTKIPANLDHPALAIQAKQVEGKTHETGMD
jgi:hypothetical protein